MDPNDPDFDPNKEEEDSKSDKDEPMPEEYRGQVELLDLSDDVLLCILRLCSPRDLKALGHTCPRLGALICDRTLWMRIDAREQPTGLERMRWLLEHCLSSVTQELHVRGYVERESRCLGIQDLTWQNNETGGADDQCLLRMWYPYLPRYAMSPRWPDKREAAGKAYSRDKKNNSRAPLLSHLASQIVAGASNPGPSGNNNANVNDGASCSNDNASNSGNSASNSNNMESDLNKGASCSKKEASDSYMEIDLDNKPSCLKNTASDSNNTTSDSNASDSKNMSSNSNCASSDNVASNSAVGILASNIDNNASSGITASDSPAKNSGELNSGNSKPISGKDSNLNGYHKNSCDTGSKNDPSKMDIDTTHADTDKSDLNAKFLNPNKVKMNMVGSKAKPLNSNAVSKPNKAAASQNKAASGQNKAASSPNKAVASQNKAASSQHKVAWSQNKAATSHNKAASKLNKAVSTQNKVASRQNTPGSSQNKTGANQNTAGSSQKAALKNKKDSSQQKEGPARKIKKVKTRNVGTNTGKTMYRLNRGLYRRLNAGRLHMGRPYGLPRDPVAPNAANLMAPNLDVPILAARDVAVPNIAPSNANAPASNSNEPASNSNKPGSSASKSDTNPGTSNGEASNASAKSESNQDMASNLKMDKDIGASASDGPEMAPMADSPMDNIPNGEADANLVPKENAENPDNENVMVANGEAPNAEPPNQGEAQAPAPVPPPAPRNNNEILRGMIRRRRVNVPQGDIPELVPAFPGVLPEWAYPGMRGRANKDNVKSKEAKEVMDAIIANCPGPQFTLDHVMIRKLRNKCHNLTSLSLEYCNLDYKATNLRHFPQKLKKLSLKGTRCYNLPLNSSLLGKIQDRLPALEYLDISECEWFEPASLLSLSKLPNLEQLFMKDCKRLTECVAYASLATRYGFQKLKVLDVRGSLVADSEVSAFGWLPLLEELYVSPPEDTRSFREHSHKWEDELAPFTELDPWEAEVPDYYKCKSPNSPHHMDEDEEVGEEKMCDMMPDVERAALESRIIVIHPNRNQNEPNYEVLRPEAVRPDDIDPRPQDQPQQELPQPSNEDEIAALEGESLEPDLPPSNAFVPLNDLPGVQDEPSNNSPGPSNENLPKPEAKQPEAMDNAQPGPSSGLRGSSAVGPQDFDSSGPSSSDSSHEHVDCDPESECHDKFKPGTSKRPHDNDQDKSKKLRLDKETSTTQDRQEQRARINAMRNNMARNNPNAYVRVRNGMPIVVPPNPNRARPMRGLAFEIWRARDRHGPPILFPIHRNNVGQVNNQAQGGRPAQENQQNGQNNEGVQANGQPNENQNNDQANNENRANVNRLNNGIRDENGIIWDRFHAIHRRQVFPEYEDIAGARPMYPGQVGRDPVQGAQADENNGPNDQPNGDQANVDQPNGNGPNRENLDEIRGFHRRRFIPALIRQHGFRRILQRNAEEEEADEWDEDGVGADDPPVWQRIRGIQRRGLIPAIIAGRPINVGPPILVNQPHEPGEIPQVDQNHEPQVEIVDRYQRIRLRPDAVPHGEGVQDENHAQENPEPANDGGNAEPDAPVDPQANNEEQPRFHRFRRIYNPAGPAEEAAGQQEPNAGQQEPNAEPGDADIPNEGANRRDYRRRMIPALVQDGNVPIVHLDLEAPPRNMPHGFPLFGWYLVTDSAVLRFGRADNEHYIPIGDFQPNERGVRPDRSNLRVLSITGFRNITNRSLEHLATAAPYLRRIDFSQTSVTAQGVEIFRAIRPDCEVIFSPFQRM